MGQGCAQQVLLSTLTLLDLFALLLRVQGSVFVSVSAFVSLCVNVPRARCCDGAWHRRRELVAGRPGGGGGGGDSGGDSGGDGGGVAATTVVGGHRRRRRR